MTPVRSRIDFSILIKAEMANPNGDPEAANMPRLDNDGNGLMSAECIKRKLRNRMQDMGYPVFLQSDSRTDDGLKSLAERAEKNVGKPGIPPKPDKNGKVKPGKENIVLPEIFKAAMCEKYIDVRFFGSTYAYWDKMDSNVNSQGPLTIKQCRSLSPIEIEDMQITKSVNGKKTDGAKASDTMGRRYMVPFGIYRIDGSINTRLAQKYGLSMEDVEVLKECVRTMFMNDESSARPAGSMSVIDAYWFTHDSTDGRYGPDKVFNSLKITRINPKKPVTSVDDYEITLTDMPSVTVEVIPGW